MRRHIRLTAMSRDAPEPGMALNEGGEVTVPRQSATVIVLRGGADRVEVLLCRRTPKARFMGGAWVSPAGAPDAEDTHRAAAVGEVEEEPGIHLPDAEALVPFPPRLPPREST